MREIKFRAWDKFNNRFYTQEEMNECGGYYYSFGVDNEYDEYPIQQFTGLLDKNGKDIYEGDILSVDWDDVRYPKHTIGPVCWDNENACWSLGEGGSPMYDAKNYMTVIGNIHQTPELLN